MPKDVVGFGFGIGCFVGKPFDEFVITPNLNIVGFKVFQPQPEGGIKIVIVSASVLRIASFPVHEVIDGDSIVGKVDEAVGFNGIATTQVDEAFVFV